ncbi:hypothetical protein [Streptomyces sp. NPDC054765]
MPTLNHALNQVTEGLGNVAGLASDHASQVEEAVHGALSRALVTLANEGPVAFAQRAGTQTTQAATQAAAWVTELPGRRVAELLPLPTQLSSLLPQHTVAELLRTVPAAAAQAAEAVRGGAATAEEAVHDALGRALVTLANEGPAAFAQQAGTSLVEVSRWAGGALVRFPSAAQQALLEAVPLPQWCTRLTLRWAASYAAAHIYGAARQAGQTAVTVAGELGAEAMRMMDTVDQELHRICEPAEASPEQDTAAGPAAAPEPTAQQVREAQLRAFRATLLGLGLEEVEELIGRLTTGADPLDADRLAVAREFQTLQWAAVAGGPEAYLRGFDAERSRLGDRISELLHKQDKITPSRVLPYAVLSRRYPEKHARQEAELAAFHARLAEIEALRETVVRGSQEIGVLLTLINHVQGPSATNMKVLKPQELAACEQLLQQALADARGDGDPARLRALLDRVRNEPDARSMLNVVHAEGIVGLYVRKERHDRRAEDIEARRAEHAPGWLEWAGLREPDPDRVALAEQGAGLVAEARAISAEYARLISLYESPEYAQRTARAEADLKTIRDHDFRSIFNQEYKEASDRVAEALVGKSDKLLQAVDILLDRVKGDHPEGLGSIPTTFLEGLAEYFSQLAAAAGPFYDARDFALLLREVEKELAARRAGSQVPAGES